MATKLKILFVTSEMTPLVSTGGLADVSAALPKALRAQGHDVRIVLPCYSSIPQEHRGEQSFLCKAELNGKTEYGALRTTRAPGTDIPLHLIEHEGYFGREKPYGVGAYEYTDNAERFSFFSLAMLHGIQQTGWQPDIVHCHDWQTGAVPAFLKTRFNDTPFWAEVNVVYTIHNLAFQGRYDAANFATTGLDASLLSPDYAEYHGDMNLMKAAITFADQINTVSPRYAREIQTLEYGEGLDGVLCSRSDALCGILNGVDYSEWNPETDPHLPANFSVEDLSGKALCKRALQRQYGLPESDVPLYGVVSRLYWQKGVDLIMDALEDLAQTDLQLVVLGTGDPALHERLDDAARRHPEKIAVYLGFDVPLSHQVIAGCDFFLMPSRYEPCGLTQLYSLAYGTLPIVRKTGGLADTVVDVNPVTLKRGTATGFSFTPSLAPALERTVLRAQALYADPAALTQVRRTGMAEEFSWERACREYETMYGRALNAG